MTASSVCILCSLEPWRCFVEMSAACGLGSTPVCSYQPSCQYRHLNSYIESSRHPQGLVPVSLQRPMPKSLTENGAVFICSLCVSSSACVKSLWVTYCISCVSASMEVSLYCGYGVTREESLCVRDRHTFF